MINRIIEFSARNRALIVVLTICLTVIGVWSLRSIPLDAIPDLSDPQVIIYTEWPGRSPDLIEAQITYPIVSAMLAAPHVSTVRGSSDYGFSYVYVIFDEGTDIYWGRTRVLEYMSKITGQLPEGVSPKLGPDATGVGWAFQYALVDKTGQNNLQQLRSFNDWYLRYWLSSVPGVAEVATIGGFVKQYQVNVDPNRLLAYKVPLTQVMDAVRNGNNEVGARSLEMTGKEYLIRGRGYIQSLADIQNLAVAVDNGTPVRVRDIARVELGPDMRRGIAELNGEGEVTGGTVVVRYGQNVRQVLQDVKHKLDGVKPSFPPGVELVTTYDRSDLIDRSIDTLRHTLIEELIIVSVVILIFLWHIPSAIIPILTIPIAVILSFIPMHVTGLTANIMSLGGIAIAIGAMVDASIVVVEQTHKRLEHWEAEGRPGSAPPT
jgi:Cu(I)/Ag(I) efflux system membrane protein CusA/SilA